MDHSAQVEIHVAHLAVVSMDAVPFLMLYVVLIIYTAVQMVTVVLLEEVGSTLFIFWFLLESAFVQLIFICVALLSQFFDWKFIFLKLSVTLCDNFSA